jgi:hypothetical protein
MKVKRNLSTPETRAWWAEVDRKADRYKKMHQHDLEKSFTHTNPEPTTDPPLETKRSQAFDCPSCGALYDEKRHLCRVCGAILDEEAGVQRLVGQTPVCVIKQIQKDERERCARVCENAANEAMEWRHINESRLLYSIAREIRGEEKE